MVSDVGSTKGELVAALGDDERFIGGHPLAGAETAGVENARADLFEGARWYLTPTERSSGVLYDRLQRAVAGLGARPQAIDAGAHDRLLATISHLPHVVANALAAEAAAELSRDSERMPEVGPSFRDTTRVAGSNPAIWADIFASNREAVADSVEAVARRLGEAAELIRGGDRDAVAAWHAAAGEDRRRLLESELEAGPLRELRIVVANRPGTIAALALALGEAGVNIEDMALLPGPRHDLGRGHPLGRRRRAGRARRAAGPRARPHGHRARRRGIASRGDDPLRPLGPAARLPAPARRQVDLPPRRADRGDGGGGDADRGLPRRRRHALDPGRGEALGAASSGADATAPGGELRIHGVGLRGAAPGRDRRRQRRHPAAAAAGLAGRAGRAAAGRSTATTRSAAGRSTGSPRRCARWAPT